MSQRLEHSMGLGGRAAASRRQVRTTDSDDGLSRPEVDGRDHVSGVRVVGDWAVSVGAEASTACANLAVGVVLARAAGAEGKGAFAIAMTVAGLGAAVLGLRWDRPAGHFLARRVTALPTVLTSTVLLAGTAMGLAALALAHCPDSLATLLLRGLDPSVITLIAWLVGAQCLYLGIAAVHGGLRQFAVRSRFIVACNVLQATIVCALYVLGVRDVVTYLRWYATGSWALEITWIGMLAWRYRLIPRWDWSLIRDMASFGSRSYVSLLLDIVTVQLDLILLNVMASTASVGVYSVAVAFGTKLASIPQMVAHVVFYRTSARELGSGMKTAQILRLATVAFGCGAVVVLLGGSALIVPLYGPDFALAVPTLWIMIPAMGAWGLYKLLASDLEGRGRPGLVSLSSAAANLTIVVLDVLWIPRYGVLGAAWASLIAYSVAFVLVGATFCRVTGLSVGEAYGYRREDLGAMARISGRFARRAGLASGAG